jgi:hypothetical protein
VNEFVEKCRREWKRLGVPDPVADEMAGDLAADLDEAAAEGASPEEVLGTGANDARSFAASWAAERGVVELRSRRRPRRALAALAVSAALAIVGLVLLVAAPSRTARMAVSAPLPRVVFLPGRLVRPRAVLPRIWFVPARREQAIAPGDGRAPLWWAGLGVLVVGIAGVGATALVSLRP